MKRDKLERMLPIMRCPRSGAKLHLEGDSLVSETGETYPIINGKPVLVRTIRPLHVTPPAANIVSQNIGEYRPDRLPGLPEGPKVHLGSGNVPCTHPDVISIDILPTENVDMVAEAEYLPFATGSVAFVESGAVFEHLYDPLAAAREVRRILAPGGQMYIDTAFMQGYHGFPSHYFNMTPQAVETFIVDDFELLRSFVPVGAGAAVSVENLLRKFFEILPQPMRSEALAMSGADLLSFLADHGNQARIHEAMPEHIRRSLGASTCVLARKPAGFDERASAGEEVQGLKRDYYAARVGVMQRYYEVEFYRRGAQERGAQAPGDDLAETLEALLLRAAPKDTSSVRAWREAIEALERIDTDLTRVRDSWIRVFLSAPEAAVEARTEKAAAECVSALEFENDRLRAQEIALREQVSSARAQLNAVLTSRVWRATQPARSIVTLTRRLLGHA